MPNTIAMMMHPMIKTDMFISFSLLPWILYPVPDGPIIADSRAFYNRMFPVRFLLYCPMPPVPIP